MKELIPQVDLSKRKSKIIAIEGFDAVGKHTQSMKLKKHLEDKGLNVGDISLPDYAEASAVLIDLWLKRYYNVNNAYHIASLYAINRFNAIYYNSKVLNSIANDDVFIFDRYIGSNILYTMGLLDTLKEKGEFCDFLRKYEHGLLNLPEPDVVIFLDLYPETAHRMCVNRAKNEGRVIDENEDLKFQRQCYENKEFLRLFYPNTIMIDCNTYDESGRPVSILNADEISEKVLEFVLPYLQ